jgi:hypothetical protein
VRQRRQVLLGFYDTRIKNEWAKDHKQQRSVLWVLVNTEELKEELRTLKLSLNTTLGSAALYL